MDLGIRGVVFVREENENLEVWEGFVGGEDGGGCRGWYGTTTTGTDDLVLEDLDMSLLWDDALRLFANRLGILIGSPLGGGSSVSLCDCLFEYPFSFP